MTKKLRVLIVEDSEDDAELVLRELRSGGYEPISERVDTHKAMADALKKKTWDVVISDYSMPHFNGLQALKLLRSSGLDIPCIIVSGKIGEDTAVELMKAGANDYVMKGNLTRLASAIERELGDAEVRRERKQAEEALRIKNLVFDASIAANSIADSNGIITEVNDAFLSLWGYSSNDEAIGKPIPHFLQNPEEAGAIITALNESGKWVGEYTARRKDGSTFDAYGMATDIKDSTGKLVAYQSAVIDITERKQAEDALRIKDNAVNSSINAIALSDLKGNLTYVNPAFLEMWGYSRSEEVLGEPSVSFWQMQDKAEEIIEKLQSKGGWRGELIARRKDGSHFDVQLSANMVIDETGGPMYMSGAFLDITERKQAEHNLAERMKELRAFYHLSELTEREDITLDEFYQELANLLPESWQYPEIAYARIVMGDSEFRTKNFMESDWKQSAPVKVSEAEVGRIDVGYLEERTEEDGGTFLKEERLLIDAIAERLGHITGRKRIEEALRESEDKYRTLFETSAEGILLADQETHQFQYANPAICRMLGYTGEELRTMDVAAIHPKEDLQRVLAEFEAQARGDKTLAPELPCLRKDGTIIYADVNAVSITVDGRKYSAGFFRDVTERIKANEALRTKDHIVASSINAIALADLKGDLTYVNPAFLEMWGYSRSEEVLGKPSVSFWQMQDKAEQIVEALQSEGSWRGELVAQRKDGSSFDVQLSGNMITDETGSPMYMSGAFVDITDRKQGEANLSQSFEKLQKTLESVVEAISAIAETRDPYTAGHQVRVTVLACAIAAEIGLSAETIADIKVGGILHDIGKIYVPAEILSKPGKLSDVEFNMIKSHPQIGYDIVKKIEFPCSVAAMVLSHHERIDGSGYPQGLKRDSIPIESKILAVADVVEAMSSHRPYRPALGVDKALEEITNNKGKLYDPDVVDACLKLFSEKDFKFA